VQFFQKKKEKIFYLNYGGQRKGKWILIVIKLEISTAQCPTIFTVFI
jgi:hypothetical protein